MNAGNFEVYQITDSLNQFEYSIAVTNEYDDFQGFFEFNTGFNTYCSKQQLK